VQGALHCLCCVRRHALLRLALAACCVLRWALPQLLVPAAGCAGSAAGRHAAAATAAHAAAVVVLLAGGLTARGAGGRAMQTRSLWV
jgi:hypothetical protein